MTKIPDPNPHRACQSCRWRMATYYVRAANGARQVRCDVCAKRKAAAAFTKAGATKNAGKPRAW
jgi:hypothetical protein